MILRPTFAYRQTAVIYLKKAKEKDLNIIRELAYQIWPSTYHAYLSQEQIDYMLDKMYNQTILIQQLKNGHVFIIAQETKRDIGFAEFSVLNPKEQIYKLHKLYVLPQLQGKGAGTLLVNEAVNLVKKKGATAIQLNVNRNNKAKDFYEKLGFKIKEIIDLDVGNGFFMNDYVMELAV